MPKSKKILMVCLGNICRSPLAEGILRHKLPKDYIIDSAGTANYHVNHAPDKRSILVAKEKGIDISHLRGRQFTKQDFDNFDEIFAMDKANYNDIIRLAKNDEDKAKVKMIMNELYPHQDLAVPDPYYGNLSDFNHVFELLDNATDKIIERLK